MEYDGTCDERDTVLGHAAVQDDQSGNSSTILLQLPILIGVVELDTEMIVPH